MEEKKREKVLNNSSFGQKQAFFGYHTVAEDEKTQWVLRHFNSVADWYDFMNTLLSFGIHYLWKRTAVNIMNLKKGDQVIDVCGGTGDLAVLAGRKVGFEGRVIVYDINKAMIDAGRKKRSVLNFEDRIKFVLGNAESITFEDNTFDAAMVGFGIRNVTKMGLAFAEMHRVLKPGGTLMCLEFSKPISPVFRSLYDFYSFRIMPFLGHIIAGSKQAYTHLPESIRTFPLPDKLSEDLQRIGFRNVSYKRLTNGIAVVHKGIKC
ncbi:MAG: bifunctional demethylmenaquinone methyltransferase/2-methoxy-6-polyprenyl-1,4-benzoquinol methylase UbiE [Desulfobacterales bacterium]